MAFDRERGWHLLAAPPAWWLDERAADKQQGATRDARPAWWEAAMTERLVSRASKGQLAMAAVMAGAARQMSMSVSAGLAGVSTRSVGRAAMVLAHGPHLVDAVLSGERPLKEAYAEARRKIVPSVSRTIAGMKRWRSHVDRQYEDEGAIPVRPDLRYRPPASLDLIPGNLVVGLLAAVLCTNVRGRT